MQNPPPVQVSSQPPVQAGKSSTGLDENIAALLSYIFGWLSGLIFFLIEKDSRLVRFHAMQSLLFNVVVGVVAIALWVVLFVVFLIVSQVSGALATVLSLVSILVWLVFGIGILAGWVLCLVKAFQSQYFKLPVIGNLAEKFSTK
ncbi:MAG TPA: hypothetical protein VFS90_24470 [Pyrinomonadaceae bacterium]|nr:hypothetical protein [Pyrinomonadaceae bacterium]